MFALRLTTTVVLLARRLRVHRATHAALVTLLDDVLGFHVAALGRLLATLITASAAIYSLI